MRAARGGIAVQWGGAALRQAMQQGGGEVGQQRGLGFRAGRGIVVVERQGQAARGGGGGAGGQDEGEEFQQIESGAGAQAQAAEGGRRRGPAGAAARWRRAGAASAADSSRSSPSVVRMAARPCPATTAGASGSAMEGVTRR